ncbi:hypothetical protein [Streptomyces noursei]|uniref:hypothetical protein n=1 Tax=Streptomyces noursei TaxID=1971 RepID=UPI0019628FE2|nr:hypothetical protein [Streptomyces noursei]QRX95733.1 hypothetical protein JNO44_37560 [Streptomyces noursei]
MAAEFGELAGDREAEADRADWNAVRRAGDRVRSSGALGACLRLLSNGAPRGTISPFPRGAHRRLCAEIDLPEPDPAA